MSLWWCLRWIGSRAMYCSVSCMKPMFHLKPKPSPPSWTGCETSARTVDSSAIVMTPGWLP